MSGVEPTTDAGEQTSDKDQVSVAGRDVSSEQGRGGGGGAVGGATASGGALAGKKKSSFERIVEKLAPVYPHYARYGNLGILYTTLTCTF